MTRHDSIIGLLARQDELDPTETTMMATHLAECADCRERAAAYQLEDQMIRSLPLATPPLSYRRAVREANPPALREVMHPARRVLAIAAVPLAACLLIVAFLAFATERRATPASAYSILQGVAGTSSPLYPYTGTSKVNYHELWYLLPPQVADYAGVHRAVAYWSVRDATHFRVTIHILDPVLERGTITVVLNGTTLTTYDSRTRKASIVQGITGHTMESPDEILLSLKNGVTDSAEPRISVSPTQSINTFLTALRASRSLPGIHARAQIVGHASIAGHMADIVDFAPISVISFNSSGCYATTTVPAHGPAVTNPPAGPCHHYRQAVGWARVWVDQVHPAILRYQEFGLSGIHNLLGDRNQFRYTVTSVTYRRGPSEAALSYVPPVAPTIMQAQRVEAAFGGTVQEARDETPVGYIHTSEPTDPTSGVVYRRLATNIYGPPPYRGQLRGFGPSLLPYVPRIDVLYSQVRRWHRVLTKWHGQVGIYVTGPYVLVQERKLANGVPAPFRTGPLRPAGTCRVWTGRYADGQHWLAFNQRGVTVIISSNRMSTRDLTQYVAQDVCT